MSEVRFTNMKFAVRFGDFISAILIWIISEVVLEQGVVAWYHKSLILDNCINISVINYHIILENIFLDQPFFFFTGCRGFGTSIYNFVMVKIFFCRYKQITLADIFSIKLHVLCVCSIWYVVSFEVAHYLAKGIKMFSFLRLDSVAKNLALANS